MDRGRKNHVLALRRSRVPWTVHLLVLNYNGCRLLPECLPSILEAAAAARTPCRVSVIDNSSTDDSRAILARDFPQVSVLPQPNLGLCSFNRVLAEIDEPVAILLNNDIKLAPGAIDPLVAPLLASRENEPCFLTAPLCWRFDGATYEGQKTGVGWRRGLVQATSLFPGHEAGIHQHGGTASAGAALAVDRARFLELGGFDPVFLPGRLEDLDFAFRGFLAGYRALYVPESVAYHLGFGTFHAAFGETGCDLLALRNTLLFQWLNLRHPLHVLGHLAWLPVRLAADLWQAPRREAARRWFFARAMGQALARWFQTPSRARQANPQAERAFFERFDWRRMAQEAAA
jgi:N-acetylglucosaminyl-diphospho-decaprenol L-rhamnosyltransferase